jgi:hypothetical protein
VLEENVFDMNGYKEDPTRPDTWTASAKSNLTVGERPAGAGVQPTRTWFDRNLYLSSYERLTLVKNIVSRGGGGGSVQMRVGGIARENVFLFNQVALAIGHPEADRSKLQDADIQRNLVLHDDIFLPPGAFGGGLIVGVGGANAAEVNDNVVAHFHGLKSNDAAMVQASGIDGSRSEGPENARFVRITDNALIGSIGPSVKIFGSATDRGVSTAALGRNAIQQIAGPAVQVVGGMNKPGDLAIGNSEAGANDYFAPGWSAYDQWQASGYDSASRRHASGTAFARHAKWRTAQELQMADGVNGWERDIVSYMKVIDPTYQVNENVRIDAGVPRESRRTDAPLVWQSILETGLSEDRARQAARRYDAFLVFIERARKNRRGAWDYRYTSDAINNYIRQGLGKAVVQ